MKWWCRGGLVFWGWVLTQYVFAQPLVIPEHDVPQLAADAALEYLPLNVLSTPPQLLSEVKTAPFVPNLQGVLNFGFTRQPVWVRLTLHNMNAQSRWWLSVGTVRLQSVTLYQQDEQGRWYEQRQGLDYLGESASRHRDHLFELNIAPTQSRTFYIKVESLTAIALPITLWQPLSYIAKHDQEALLQGGLYGVFIGIALYYLIVSVLLKKSTYWQFSVFLFSFAVTSAAYNGYLQLWWGPFSDQWNIRIILFSLVCTNIGLVAFVRNFLHVRRYAPLMAYGLSGSLIASGVLLIATVAWADYVTLSRLLSGWSPLNGALALVAAMWVMLKGYRPARLFLLSMTVVWVTLLLHILFMLGWVEIPFSEQIVLWSLMGVVPLMAASFADQHRLLEAEKEAALEQALELKQQSLDTLEGAIAERTHQLDQARQRAEAASEAKTNFLAVMSHELRSPMTAVLGAARLLNRQSLPQTAYELVNTLDSAGDQLLRLIDDVLDLSRAEAGQPILMPATFNPEQLVSEVYNLLKPVAAERGLDLVVTIQGTLPAALWGDASALQRVLNNLVVNATRYAEQGTITIGIECQRDGAQNVTLHCWVEDQGPGISADQQAVIFQPFEQLDQSHGRQHGGAGLGLSICRRLVEAMSGTLSLKSQPGEGARFYFSVSLPEVRAMASDDVWQRPSLRILLVEDVAMNREVLAQLLSHEGHDVTAVSGGEPALQKLRPPTSVSSASSLPSVPPFDVVLLDIQMPGMDGFEVTRQIRALPKALQPRHLLALTASYTQLMRAQCLEAGMDGLVAKPLRLSSLYQALKPASFSSSASDQVDSAPEHSPSRAMWHEYADYLDEDELEAFQALQQQTLAERLQWLQEAWSQRDWTQMERNAHDLISMLAGVGAIALSDHALALEQALKASDEPLVQSLIETLLADSLHWM